ncbi:[acyl-carrier-protein] S-malonyltransferase [Paenibacillus anaericanus]|uniref:[acyl-carrier-protein] S-malonyltransferase n=1 Tax=Paenibacillus anaericanus TaxID=170367 RepID=A0A3S1DA39_9BACL|nr:ACP S-malonyltransferase [Paenibacillus anaericanus]RUT40352.1 [acyl-carrier-protein] S-malonyltransferase [Paenibacillus anaericanus]
MKRLAVLFPGQGSQYNGMMRENYDLYPIVRQTFEEASDTLGYDMATLCFDGEEERLAQSEVTQPALLTVGLASFRLFVQETQIQPTAAAGHSLGEYTALTCAGVLRFADALQLVRERGRLMLEASTSGLGRMAAVSGIHADKIIRIVERIENGSKRPTIACFNSSQQIVLSGTIEAMTTVEELLSAEGVKMSSLKVSGAFHSPHMATAADKFEDLLSRCLFGKFDFPVISNIEAKPYGMETEDIIQNLKRQMTEPVHWRQTMACLLNRSIDAAVELAPRKTLTRLFKADYPSFPAYSLEDQADREIVFSSSFKAEYGYSHRDMLAQYLATAVSIRNRCMDDQAYKEYVVAPYRQIENLLLSLERDNAEPSIDQLHKALTVLKNIVLAKGAAEEEYPYPRIEMERMLSR